MKMAYLFDIPETISAQGFEQELENLCNATGVRLIYRIRSRNPIRLVVAENPKYLYDNTPLARPAGRGVNHATQGNRHRGLDYHDCPFGCPPGSCRGNVCNVAQQRKRLCERDGWKSDGKFDCKPPAGLDQRFVAYPVRLCLPAEQVRTQGQVALIAPPYHVHSTLYGGEPIFPGGRP